MNRGEKEVDFTTILREMAGFFDRKSWLITLVFLIGLIFISWGFFQAGGMVVCEKSSLNYDGSKCINLSNLKNTSKGYVKYEKWELDLMEAIKNET